MRERVSELVSEGVLVIYYIHNKKKPHLPKDICHNFERVAQEYMEESCLCGILGS
jgi:hypothetical protein